MGDKGKGSNEWSAVSIHQIPKFTAAPSIQKKAPNTQLLANTMTEMMQSQNGEYGVMITANTRKSCQCRNSAHACHTTTPSRRIGSTVTVPVTMRSAVSCAHGSMSCAHGAGTLASVALLALADGDGAAPCALGALCMVKPFLMVESPGCFDAAPVARP